MPVGRPQGRGQDPGDYEKEKTIRKLAEQGEPKAAIARVVGLSRPTVYGVLGAAP